VDKFHRLLLDHIGEVRVGEHCEPCITREANRLLHVGHAAYLRAMGDGTMFKRAEHDHVAGYVMKDVQIAVDSEQTLIRGRAIGENVPSALSRTSENV
jgi:hypothetical protein